MRYIRMSQRLTGSSLNVNGICVPAPTVLPPSGAYEPMKQFTLVPLADAPVDPSLAGMAMRAGGASVVLLTWLSPLLSSSAWASLPHVVSASTPTACAARPVAPRRRRRLPEVDGL
ncbi:hypothetical protein [Streptomyces sp. NPDC005955]|uniref:hypothetical protein n=1 Tax=Streptomyces sp. NPDC005955 TaxID=3364738 RepID=UPI003673C604